MPAPVETAPTSWVDVLRLPEAKRLAVSVRFGAGAPRSLGRGDITRVEVSESSRRAQPRDYISSPLVNENKSIPVSEFADALWELVSDALHRHRNKKGNPVDRATGILTVYDAEDAVIQTVSRELTRVDVVEYSADDADTVSYLAGVNRQLLAHIKDLHGVIIRRDEQVTSMFEGISKVFASMGEAQIAAQQRNELLMAKYIEAGVETSWLDTEAGGFLVGSVVETIPKVLDLLATTMANKK